MFKFIPATEKEFKMKEVDKATPSWLKWIMFGFVAIILLTCLFLDDAIGAKAMTQEEIKKEQLKEMIRLKYDLMILKEGNYDIILEDCDANYFDFYYCSMSRMYALNRVIRHLQSFGEELYYDERPEMEIAEDFEAMNEILYKWAREYNNQRTFDWIEILNEYENIYLKSKGR